MKYLKLFEDETSLFEKLKLYANDILIGLKDDGYVIRYYLLRNSNLKMKISIETNGNRVDDPLLGREFVFSEIKNDILTVVSHFDHIGIYPSDISFRTSRGSSKRSVSGTTIKNSLEMIEFRRMDIFEIYFHL